MRLASFLSGQLGSRVHVYVCSSHATKPISTGAVAGVIAYEARCKTICPGTSTISNAQFATVGEGAVGVLAEPDDPPGGLTAHECDRDMTHRRIRLCAMPMPLSSLDMRHITYVDLTLFMLGCDHTRARGDDQVSEIVPKIEMCDCTLSTTEIQMALFIFFPAATPARGIPTQLGLGSNHRATRAGRCGCASRPGAGGAAQDGIHPRTQIDASGHRTAQISFPVRPSMIHPDLQWRSVTQ